jgi:hypothetical protein
MTGDEPKQEDEEMVDEETSMNTSVLDAVDTLWGVEDEDSIYAVDDNLNNIFECGQECENNGSLGNMGGSSGGGVEGGHGGESEKQKKKREKGEKRRKRRSSSFGCKGGPVIDLQSDGDGMEGLTGI